MRPRARTNRSLLAVAACSAATLLAGCGSTPSSSSTAPPAPSSPQALVAPGAATASPVQASQTPAASDPVAPPSAAPGVIAGPTLPPAGQEVMDPSVAGVRYTNINSAQDVPPPTVALPKFTAAQLASAYLWSAQFTLERYSSTNFWLDRPYRLEMVPQAYYRLTGFLTPAARKSLADVLVSDAGVRDNQDILLALAPLSPEIDGKWLAPAVSDFRFGSAAYEQVDVDGTPAVRITLPYTASGAYRVGPDYYAFPISDSAVYTLVPRQGPDGWGLAQWEAAVEYGVPAKLSGPPANRQAPVYVQPSEATFPASPQDIPGDGHGQK